MPNSIWQLDEFKPYQREWNARRAIFSTNRAYYDGTAYSRLRNQLGVYLFNRLYKGIKPLYLPLARAVDVDAGIIPGGWAFAEDAPEAWAEARDLVFSWSRWTVDGVLYVHYGASCGNSMLKIAEAGEDRVGIFAVDPACHMLVYGEGVQYIDAAPTMAVCVEMKTGDDGKMCEYAEVTDIDRVRTFMDGVPAGVGGRDPEYPNPFGEVPFVEVKHLNVGESIGYPTFKGVIPLLDAVNEQASYLADIIAKHVEPQWAVTGAEAGELERSGDNVWFLPAGGDAKALLATIDIPGVLAFIQEIRDQVYGGLAELAFDDLRKKDSIATATLELQLMELVLKIKRCRPNYDDGLVRALQIAGRANSQLSVLNDPALVLDVTRPVLPLDAQTEMQLELLAAQVEEAQGRAAFSRPGGYA